jgi:hypothetical protein
VSSFNGSDSRIDGHHLRHWAQGGSTDLDNLVTICRAHHWKVHEGGWRLIRSDEGIVVLPPVPLDIRPPATPAAGEPSPVLIDTPWRWAPDAPPSPGRGSPLPVATTPPQARGPDEPSTV